MEAVAPTPDWRLGVVLLVLVLVAVAASVVGRLGVGREQVVASARAVAQLAVVALVITAALRSLWWSLVVVAVMFVVAAGTSARRVDARLRSAPWVALAVAAGASPVVVLALASGVVPLNGPGVVPIAGIVIGGTMTAATLIGRRAFAELGQSFGAYEAAVALGLPQRDAALLVVRPTARESLTPGLDQTRTVGLVTLPGAFVGVLLGGGTPLEAAASQLLVLIGLLAGQALTATVLLELVARGLVVRRDLAAVYPR